MTNLPLVSVIALNYNQESYIKEAFDSILNQTYKNIEIIVADDASSDNSVAVIEKLIEARPDIQFIRNRENLGNCKTFNKALSGARGKYIIDFALDDVLLPDMIEKQVNAFEQLPDTTGVVFGDAAYIDKESRFLRHHYKRSVEGKLLESVPSGDVYESVVGKFFIAPPSVMFRKAIIERLGGYDEELMYEDFDLWVRASRKYHFHYLDEVIVKKRILRDSLSSVFYRKENQMIESTYRICEKIMWLNKSESENNALAKRIRYEMRHALLVAHFTLAARYAAMLKGLKQYDSLSKIVAFLAYRKVDLYNLYRLYLKARFKI